MEDPEIIRFYLDPGLRKSAETGRHNFIAKLANVLKDAQCRVEFHDVAAAGDPSEPHRSLTHMRAPPNRRGLLFRRVYHYPFWQIEARAERWYWDVAGQSFAPQEIAPEEAHRFYLYWRKRLFGSGPQTARHDGFVYVPLQGRLNIRRSFQSCSPLQMIDHCLAHETTRPIIAALHPKERYTEAELTALADLERRHPRLSIRTGDMEALLQGCDYVVTQNSSAGFSGYFFGKPLLLFAEIDFHHIAVKADHADLQRSFAEVVAHQPDYARYMWWFWQDRSINAGRPDAEAKITARLRRFGWPI